MALISGASNEPSKTQMVAANDDSYHNKGWPKVNAAGIEWLHEESIQRQVLPKMGPLDAVLSKKFTKGGNLKK